MSASAFQDEQKAVLVDQLEAAREAVLWKLDGLGEHDVRRRLTPTGTNLLGLAEHLASNELGYSATPSATSRGGTERR